MYGPNISAYCKCGNYFLNINGYKTLCNNCNIQVYRDIEDDN